MISVMPAMMALKAHTEMTVARLIQTPVVFLS